MGTPQVPAANLDPDAQATAGATATVASFWRGFSRESWDGRGGDMDAYVDWQFVDQMGNPGNNAQWDGSRTMYSPQWSAPDVVGHEFTHGLIQATAGLVYVDESGAANEHYADLFGNLIFPDVLPTGWLVGEDIPPAHCATCATLPCAPIRTTLWHSPRELATLAVYTPIRGSSIAPRC